jgi:hypothetical protein
MAKLLPPSKSSIIKSLRTSVIKADKFLNFNKPSVKISKSSSILDTVKKIENKVIQVDKLLKDSLLLSKKEDKKTRIKKEGEEFSEREKELEKKLPKPEKEVKLPSAPKLGFFGWIKNFITQTVLGFLAVRLIGFLPQLLKILPVIINVSDFIIDWGGKLLDGLVTFIDWGYKTYDATRGFVKNIFGDDGVKKFDELSGVLNKFLNLAIIAGMVAAGSGGFGGGGKGASPKISGGTPKVTTSGGGAAGRLDVRNPLRQRPTVTTSGGGAANGLDIRNPLRQRPIVTTGGGGKGALLSSVRPFLKRIPLPVVGALIDFGLSVALGENPGRAAFRAIGAGLLGALGAVIGSVVPVAGNFIGGMIGGVTGDLAGGALYDLFFGGKPPKKGKVNKLAGGGIPKTSRSKSARRTLKKKKPKRTVSFIPRKIKPGADTGGEKKVRKVFPNPEKAWWDPFGIFTGKSKEQTQEPKKPTEKTTNPQEFLVKSNNNLGKADFFGPFFTIALKSVLGQKPDLLDYKNAGRGLNSWIQTTFKSSPLGFSGGGEVDAQKYFGGEDYTNVIAKSVEDSVSKEVNTTIHNLSRELSLRPVGREEMLEKNNEQRPGEENLEDFDGELSGSGMEMARGIYKKLIMDGIPASAAAGIVGNIGAESNFDPAIIEKGTGIGRGWIQWSYGRRTAFENWAKRNKINPDTPEANYGYLLYEMKGNDGNHWMPRVDTPQNLRVTSLDQYIKKATDPETAAKLFMYNYERPRSDVQHLDRRIKYAKEVSSMKDIDLTSNNSYRKGKGRAQKGFPTRFPPSSPGKFNSIEYITGDPKHSNFELKGHGLPSNYHDHIAFKTIADKERAKRALRSAGIKIGSELRPGDRGYHGINLAIDVPGYQWGGGGSIGRKEFEGSKKVRSILGFYEKGGETLDKPHLAMIGEKGTEYVIDADSYKETEKVAPGLLDILNYDIHDRNSLKKYMPSIINSLNTYMDYEQPYAEPEIVEVPIEIEVPLPIGGEGGTGTSISMMRDIDNSVPGMDILDAIG